MNMMPRDVLVMCFVWTLHSVIGLFKCGVIRKWCDEMSVWYRCDELWCAWCRQDMVQCHMKVNGTILEWYEYGMVWYAWFVLRHITFIDHTILRPCHTHARVWSNMNLISHHIRNRPCHVYITLILHPHHNISHPYQITSVSYQFTFISRYIMWIPLASHPYHGASHTYHFISLRYYVTNTSQHITCMILCTLRLIYITSTLGPNTLWYNKPPFRPKTFFIAVGQALGKIIPQKFLLLRFRALRKENKKPRG